MTSEKRVQQAPDVHVTGHGGGADVEPILIIGSQLLPVVGLHQVHPLGNLHLARPKKKIVMKDRKFARALQKKITENL